VCERFVAFLTREEEEEERKEVGEKKGKAANEENRQ
jgi:hypothetical protein